ncbi:MAG: hypothetical protein PHQ40_16450 [Anaerolineaceae bacterium]|nr:hypothetical protein [Anaerolineaceae bacterium]
MQNIWGEQTTKEAARQLGLDESYTIVMMSMEIEYVEDARSVIDEFEEDGFCCAKDVVEAIEDRIISVQLPKGLVLVGMAPRGEAAPRTYGIINLRSA